MYVRLKAREKKEEMVLSHSCLQCSHGGWRSNGHFRTLSNKDEEKAKRITEIWVLTSTGTELMTVVTYRATELTSEIIYELFLL
jgi:CRISPR/Cas system-associated protein Csx1